RDDLQRQRMQIAFAEAKRLCELRSASASERSPEGRKPLVHICLVVPLGAPAAYRDLAVGDNEQPRTCRFAIVALVQRGGRANHRMTRERELLLSGEYSGQHAVSRRLDIDDDQ